MDRDKRAIVILVIIIILAFNYGMYSYYISPKYEQAKKTEQRYQDKKIELAALRAKEPKEGELEAEKEKLKQALETFSKSAPNQMDTPQLVYDFYTYFKKKGIQGVSMRFSLPALNKAEAGAAASKSKQASTTTNNTNNSNKENNKTNATDTKDSALTKMEIAISAKGDKKIIEKYIRELDSITKRKLNVKSITMSSEVENKDVNNSQSTVIQGGLAPSTTDTQNITLVIEDNSDKMLVELVFYAYVDSENANNEQLKQYGFYDTKIGFNSIVDMFGIK